MFFVSIYNYFERHKSLFYLILCCLILICGFLAYQVNFVEDITHAFPKSGNNKSTEFVFKNLKSKDKIIVLLSTGEDSDEDPDLLIKIAGELEDDLRQLAGNTIRSIQSTVDGNAEELVNYIYQQLPIYISEDEYHDLENRVSREGVDKYVKRLRERLELPIDQQASDFLRKNPFGLGGRIFSSLGQINSSYAYEIYEDHIFSEDLRNMIFFINPAYGISQTSENKPLIQVLDKLVKQYSENYKDVSIHFCGGPTVAVHNASLIRHDIRITLICASILISLLTWFAFRRFSSLFLIMIPVLFGGIFALAIIKFITSSMSLIALGASAAVFGIAASYSIHIINHSAHGASPSQIIKELTFPMTIGSFTTIGAFVGLMFTSSKLLYDFGLFSALALTGTTLFSLVFLPHFLPQGECKKNFNWLSKFTTFISRYPYEKNYWLIGAIMILTVVGILKCGDVHFDGDLSHLNDEPGDVIKTEKKIEQIFSVRSGKVFISIFGDTENEAASEYLKVCEKLRKLQEDGKIHEFTAVDFLLLPDEIRMSRLQEWNRFWTQERRDELKKNLKASSAANGFKENAFDDFIDLVDTGYQWDDPMRLSAIQTLDFFESWIDWTKKGCFCLCQIVISPDDKAEVYAQFANSSNVLILDRKYFSNTMTASVASNFNLVLCISSLIVFLGLLLSYGRLELACMSFLPMNISFLIILGLMALFDIPFNIVNIILCTFIYGIGDDFSIFVMDGLTVKYRENKDVLQSHKTAVFFSSAVILIGMGTLIFARHPALHSVGLISIHGMFSVVIVSYTVQPLLFNLFIDSQTRKGQMPYTICSIIRTGTVFGVFVAGCFLVQLIFMVFFIFSRNHEKMELCYHRVIQYMMRMMLFVLYILRIRPHWEMNGEDFSKPAVIILNHQSFLDILIGLSLHPKIIMITKRWVWNSPFFGRIVRACGFYSVDDGYDNLAERLIPYAEKGYSIVIFPEGTRSENENLQRFHKGAFYLAERLCYDILPIVLYGTGHGCNKKQSMFIRPASYKISVLPRIKYNDHSYGVTYQEKQKNISRYFADAYGKMKPIAGDPYFYYTLVRNYIYKGPVLEWYTRIKVRMEHEYHLFNDLIPSDASVVDIGCGYGQMDYMLMLFSAKRRICGIDYDPEKIDTASNCFLRKNNMYKERIRFFAADAVDFEYPNADVFILSDVLHYMYTERQLLLIGRCMEKLNPNGKIIIRDGDSKNVKTHWVTLLTEFISTKLTRFNQLKETQSFFDSVFLEEYSNSKKFHVKSIRNDNFTSNTIFILERKEFANEY